MSQTTTLTQTEAELERMRAAGAPIEKGRRPYLSKRMQGFNAEVYAAWIERWANNAAVNYPVVNQSDGVAFLRNCAKDVPAIVVGIGPSLDDEILILKNAPRHAVIIATDAALRPLLRHGIKPDLVVNYDARDHQKTMWDTIDTSGLVLLANTVTSPETIAAWKGKAMFFNMMQSDDEFASNILPALFPFTGQLPNLGTVGNGAVFLAWQMGCKPIITVGMDMCYRVDSIDPVKTAPIWRYRCKDWKNNGPVPDNALASPDGNWWVETENLELYNNAERMAETSEEIIKEKTYRTDRCLMFYRNSLVSSIGQFDMPVINCSGGAMTDLIKTMTLKDAMEEKCHAALDPGRTIAKHLFKLILDGKSDFRYWEKQHIFVPKE